MFPAWVEMDDDLSVQGRWLGGLRQGLHQGGFGKSAVRRSQCDAGPGMRRHHGADSRIAGLRRLPPGTSAGAEGVAVRSRAPGGGRLVVWALGRELHLWN